MFSKLGTVGAFLGLAALVGGLTVQPAHAQVRAARDVMTLQGSPLKAVVASSDVQVNGAHIRGEDIVATNGVIHAIDTVITPKDWQLLAAAA